MAFIAGKGFAILNSKAEKGDQKAKDLLAKLDSIDQEEADRLFSEILGKGGGGGSSKDKKVKAPGASATDGQGKITEGDGEQPPTGKTKPKKAGEAPVAAPAEPTGEVKPKGTPLSENTLFQAKVKLGDELTKGDIEAWSYISGLSNDEVRETYDKLKGTPTQSKAAKPADPLSNENLQALFDSGLDTDGVIDQVRTQMRDVQLDPNDPYKNSDLQGIVEGFETGYKPGGAAPAAKKESNVSSQFKDANEAAKFSVFMSVKDAIDDDLDFDENEIQEIADEYGVSTNEVSKIIRGYQKQKQGGTTIDTAGANVQPAGAFGDIEPETLQLAGEGLVTDLDIERLGEELGISNQEARREYEKAGAQFDTANSVYQPDAKTLLETLSPEQPRLRTAEDARTQELLEFEPEQPAEVGTSFDNALKRTGGNLSGDDVRKLAEEYGISVNEVYDIADQYKAEQGTKPEKFSSVTPTFQEDPKPLYNDPEEAVRETLLFEGGSLSDGDKQGIADEFGISIDEVNQLIRKEQSTTPFRMEDPTPLPNEETQRQVAALDTEIERIRNTQYRNPDDAKNFVDDITNYESDGRPLTESEFNYYASQNNLSKDEAEKAYQEYGDKVYDNIPYSWEEEEERPGEDEKDRRDGAIKDIRDAFNKFGPSRGLSREQIINIATGNSLSEQDVEKLVDEQFAASQPQPTRTVTGQQQVQGQGVKVPPTKETAAAPDRKKLEKAAEDLGVDPNLLEGLLELLKKVR